MAGSQAREEAKVRLDAVQRSIMLNLPEGREREMLLFECIEALFAWLDETTDIAENAKRLAEDQGQEAGRA